MLKKSNVKKEYEYTCKECGMTFVVHKSTAFRWDGGKGLLFDCPSCGKTVPVKTKEIKIIKLKQKLEEA